ncbi:MAG TPA: DegT/DnrJ/EryC1/StrS family aminotransferase [Armatimonadota bacterium]|jgi:dTDP-4-amino-4,6-dideoxygalactose transaminase
MSEELAVLGGKAIRSDPFPQWPVHGDAERASLLEALDSGRWSLGNEAVERFEETFARLHGCKYAVTVTSGTVALRTALLAAGIRAGDEVIMPAYTFQATATAIVEANAVPVFADVDRATLTLSPTAFEAAITPRTRFVLPVHFAGLPSDMDAILDLAARHGITVIEDACQAHGASLDGRPVGSMGAAGCFSFQSSKNLNCGEGGAIVTSDETLARRCRQVRNCGRGATDPESDLGIAGNYRLTGFQAAVLNAQLTRFEGQFATRERNAALLTEMLADVPGIIPQYRSDRVTRHAYHLYSFRYDASVYGVSREVYLAALMGEGIAGTAGYTEPLYRMPLFAREAYGPYTAARRERLNACPVTEAICHGEGAWLYQKLLLGSDEDTRDIGHAFAKLYRLRDHLREVRL